jgi:hypothetical protein
MNAVTKPKGPTPPTTVAELVAYQRTQRRGTPAGDILEPAMLVENLTLVLTGHVEELRERWPTQETRWDGNRGHFVSDGPPPPPFDLSTDATAKRLATLIGYLEERVRS